MPIPGTFDDPKKHAPHPSYYPIISGISVSFGSDSAVISWTTDIASSSQVAYGANQNKDQRSGYFATPVTSHSVTINGLVAGTVYFYNVQSFYIDSLSVSMQYAFTLQSPNFIQLEDLPGTLILEDGTNLLLE